MKRLIASFLEFPSAADEDEFIQHVINEVEHNRQLMGYENMKGYRSGTLLDRWDTYQKMWEQDFESRKANNALFAESNLTLNLPLTQISQHSDKMSNDLVSTPAFFGPVSEGSEDENPNIDTLKQRLLHRAKQTNLHESGRRGIVGALIRGQEILRAGYSQGAYLKPTKVKAALLDGKAIKDSSGAPVLSTDRFIVDEAFPEERYLERDPMVRIPTDSALTEGPERVVMQRMPKEPGCDLRAIHYGDFFTVPNAETLEEAHIKGHAFRQPVGDLMLNYPAESRAEAEPGQRSAFDQYYDDHKQDKLGLSTEDDYTVQASLPRERDGEDDDIREAKGITLGRFRRRTFYEVWIRYDADKDGYAEDIYVLMDVEQKIPVHYEYASIILPWSDQIHPHPYLLFRIWPKLHRWTGRGYYELLETWVEVTDRMLNRIEIDSATSGNVVFENSMATIQGMDGEGINFRNRLAYQLTGGYSAQEALSVVTVQPANIEIFSQLMDKFIGRVEISGGLTSPQDSSVTDIPGSDTLGVAKILENTANQSLRARETELVTGLTAMLNAFVDIELYAMTQDPVALAKQVGDDKAGLLLEWVKTFPEDVRNVFEVSLTKAHSSQMIETGSAVLNVLEKWVGWATGYKQMHAPEFVNILKGLGAANPDLLLNVPASMEADMMMAEAQAAAEGQDNQPPTENR